MRDVGRTRPDATGGSGRHGTLHAVAAAVRIDVVTEGRTITVDPPRPATGDDVEALVDVIEAVAPEGSIGMQPPVDRDALRERFRGAVAAEAPAGIWVVETAGTVVGYVGLHAGGPVGTVGLAMAIRREGRGRGAGRRLVDVALAHARRHDVHRVELEAWLDNARAIALYASAGFEVEGVRRERYRRRDGSLRSSLMMVAHLRG